MTLAVLLVSVYLKRYNYLFFQSGEELMLIPQEEEKPAVTLKMSRSVTDEDKENSENYSHPVQS